MREELPRFVLARFPSRAIYVVLVIASLGIAAHRPLLFQKLNTLTPADGFPELSRAGDPLDVAKLLRSIPLNRVEAWTVDPARRYQRTIVEGGATARSSPSASRTSSSGRESTIRSST